MAGAAARAASRRRCAPPRRPCTAARRARGRPCTGAMMRAPDCNTGMAARAQTSAGCMTEADGRAAAARQNRAQAAAHAGDAAHRMPGLLDMDGLAGLMGQDGLQHQCPNEPEGRANPGSRQAVKDPGLAFCRVYTGWTQPIQRGDTFISSAIFVVLTPLRCFRRMCRTLDSSIFSITRIFRLPIWRQ